MIRHILAMVSLLLGVAPAGAHDAWVQTNANIVRLGDNIHIDLMLGNHGNNHRDFKLASKLDLAGCTLEVLDPSGKRYDLRDRLLDTGYTPKEGFWSARFAGAQSGLYLVTYTSDRIVTYAPVRAVQSAKALFVASKSLDRIPSDNRDVNKPLGHAFELVPEANPVTPMGPEVPIKVRLFFKGKPLAKARVSFIPRGETLSEGFDARYERTTDDQGRAAFTPKEGNYYLIVAHREEPKESGRDYQSTKYAATLCVFVPQVCACCGE